MDEDYGREEWQTDESAARAEAIRRIHAARDSGADTLDFSDLTALTALPEELALVPGLRRLFAGWLRADGKISSTDLRRLSEISALRPLTALTLLNLSHTQVADLSPLATLTALTTLDLSGTQVADLAPLAPLTALTTLDLSGTEVTDLAPLAPLTALTSLHLSSTQVADLAPLAPLTALSTLDLGETPVADLAILLQLPEFAGERGQCLSFYETPAADPAKDRRMEMLAGLPPERCAIETVQYLKGTHPDFRDPPGGKALAPLAARLAAASPVDIRRIGDVLDAVNPGQPERVNRLETGQRLDGLRAQVALVAAEAGHSQCPPAVLRRLTAYADGLQADPPVWFVIDSALDMVRGSLDDAYLTEAMDKGLQAGFRGLFKAHDALRPFLMPPSDAEAAALDALPDLRPDVTAREVRDLTHEAVEIVTAPDTREAVGLQMVRTLQAFETLALAGTELAQAAKGRIEDRPGFLRRVVAPFAGTLSVLADAVSVHGWWLGPTGTALATRLQPLLDKVLALFA